MEFLTLMNRFIICTLCLGVMTLAESSTPDWMERSVRSVQKTRHVRTHSNDIAENDGFLHSFKEENKVATDCCFNGGLCIMNSFCHCKEGFHGRYCEHQTHDRSCGTISHGTWLARGCYLCHCFDGNMRCKTTQIPSCENIDFVQGQEASPDYQVDVDNKFADYERFYDVSGDDVTSPQASGSTLPVSSSSSYIVLVMVFAALVRNFYS